MSSQRIAVVTGANKGIGFEICRQFTQKRIIVVLTARDKAKGKAAQQKLAQLGLEVLFHELDVTNVTSAKALARYLEEKFGHIDILINNAGVFLEKWDQPALSADLKTVQEILETNFYGPFRMIQVLAPLLKKSQEPRIVNVSSGMGTLTDMDGNCPGYRVSKTGLNALTRIFATELKDHNVKVNSMCPGWVRTDMGGEDAERTVEEGADTAVWLATENNIPTGKYFRDRKEILW